MRGLRASRLGHAAEQGITLCVRDLARVEDAGEGAQRCQRAGRFPLPADDYLDRPSISMSRNAEATFAHCQQHDWCGHATPATSPLFSNRALARSAKPQLQNRGT